MENEKKRGRPPREDGRKPRTVANQKYNDKAYERINLTVAKGNKEVIRARATERGESVNRYINMLIKSDIPDFKTLDGTGENTP